MHARYGSLALLPLLLIGSACGGKASASASTVPTSDPNAVPTGTAPTGYPTAAPTAAPAAPPPMTGTGPAIVIAPMAAAVVAPLLTQMGTVEAPGAQPDGSPFAGQFAAGQTLEQVINIKGNGCYTIVGASVGIQQLDIALVVQPTPLMQPITVAQSSGAGPNATLGGKATGCWRNPTPLAGTGKVILRATSGQGLAAAQVFSK
ncbi:MAG TPA: hypothetical protein VLT33_37065 [Labilithrix sp.]|nr:hypothetical protein [Labilithrix sp.]